MTARRDPLEMLRRHHPTMPPVTGTKVDEAYWLGFVRGACRAAADASIRRHETPRDDTGQHGR
ncbi:unnamed protein product [uncultured bacterium]|nr:unnamed protein product [uncultured bacterium]